ncbi:sulfotransferase domain-containing protein [Candidatus Pelagibacter sp.]|nr:sulfotransferase domain-containing protein [Candidatus Pelagibacter sp.]
MINLDNKLHIFKTHHILCSLGEDNFTDEKNSLGAIYIVRDPRNVISSVLYHFNLSNTDEALNFIQTEERFLNIVKNKVNYTLDTLIGSWKTNYNSWKIFGKNFLLVKYEDLILSPNTEFKRIANYITNTTNIKFSEEQIKKSIEESSFENLQKLEDKNGFIESIKDPENKKKKKFFNLGPRNNWKKNLDKKFVDKIEDSFKDEMKELGYI